VLGANSTDRGVTLLQINKKNRNEQYARTHENNTTEMQAKNCTAEGKQSMVQA
jgi:hypothetical protein